MSEQMLKMTDQHLELMSEHESWEKCEQAGPRLLEGGQIFSLSLSPNIVWEEKEMNNRLRSDEPWR
jgi:hypothetical protein